MKYSVNVLVYICRLVNSNPNNFSFLWIEEAVNDPGLSPFEMIKFDIVFPSFMCRQLDSSFILYNMKGKIVWERYILGFIRTFLPSFLPKIYQNGLNIWNWAFKHLNCLESSNLSWNCKASCFSDHGEGFSFPFFYNFVRDEGGSNRIYEFSCLNINFAKVWLRQGGLWVYGVPRSGRGSWHRFNTQVWLFGF